MTDAPQRANKLPDGGRSFAIYDATGAVRRWVSGAAAPDISDEPGMAVLEVPFDTAHGPDMWSVVSGALAPRIFTLADKRRAKTLAAVAYLNSLQWAGFAYAGVLYQIDPASQSNIAAMATMALASIANPRAAPWPAGFTWIAADNSHVAMDAPTMLAFGHAVGGYVSACVLRLRAIKDAIAAAADQAALDAIDVTAGYPSMGAIP